MGTYEKGVLGGFNGKIGTVIGSSWMGVEYMKSLYKKSKKAASKKQLVQREKFKVMSDFISSLGGLLKTSFKDPARLMTGRNNAFSYNFDNEAVIGDYPLFSLDYSRILISKGVLLNVINPVASVESPGIINFAWTNNAGMAMANETDKAVVAIYCPELRQAIYTTQGAARTIGGFSVNAGNFTGRNVETWICFATDDEDAQAVFSTSIYTGQLTIV